MTQNKKNTKTYTIDKISTRTGGYKNTEGTWINPSDKEAKRELLTKYKDFKTELNQNQDNVKKIHVKQETHPDPKNPNKKIYTKTYSVIATTEGKATKVNFPDTTEDQHDEKRIQEANPFTGKNKPREKENPASSPKKYEGKTPRVVSKAGSLNTALKVLEQTQHGIKKPDKLLSEAIRLSDNILRYTHTDSRP